MNGATPTTQDTPDKGRLQINLVSDITAYPIQGARISISYTGIPETPLEQLTTDSSGQTDMIDLAAPPLEYSLDPENEIQPYSEYTLQISAAGYDKKFSENSAGGMASILIVVASLTVFRSPPNAFCVHIGGAFTVMDATLVSVFDILIT